MKCFNRRTAKNIRKNFLEKFFKKRISLNCVEEYRDGSVKDVCNDKDLSLSGDEMSVLIHLSQQDISLAIDFVERGSIMINAMDIPKFYFEDDMCIIRTQIFEGEMVYEFSVQ